jgi:hypothetical protein
MSITYLDSYKESCLLETKVRHAAQAGIPNIFTDIYKEDHNIAIWKRELPQTLSDSVKCFLLQQPFFKTSMTVTPKSVSSSLDDTFGDYELTELKDDIVELVDMYCCLFELKRTGLRLTALDRAMCPRFHVDNVPCRLLTTYSGIATEWLAHKDVNREKLGPGNDGLPDDKSGIYHSASDICQLQCGDVALLKGERWEGNENAGLVHRSPRVGEGEHRLLLSLDFN